MGVGGGGEGVEREEEVMGVGGEGGGEGGEVGETRDVFGDSGGSVNGEGECGVGYEYIRGRGVVGPKCNVAFVAA